MDTQPIASSARALRHVFLRDLVLAASIGVHPHEHARRSGCGSMSIWASRTMARGRCRAAGRARRTFPGGGLREGGRHGARDRRRRPCQAGGDTGGAHRRSLPRRSAAFIWPGSGWKSLIYSPDAHRPGWRSSAARPNCPRAGTPPQQVTAGLRTVITP